MGIGKGKVSVRSAVFHDNTHIDRGVAKWPKAPGFDPDIRRFESYHPCQTHNARVVELVDAPDSKSGSERSVGSTPTMGTNL